MGLAMPLGKAAITRGVTPLGFVVFPALASGLLLMALAWARHGAPRRWRELAVFGLTAGLLGQAILNTLVAWLSATAGASFSGLAYTLPPVFTLIYLLLLRQQQASAARLGAVALGLSGALWLAMLRLGSGDLSATSAALLFAIPAVIGAGNVYRALRLPPGVPAEWLGAALTLGAFVLLLPLWLWREAGAFQWSTAGLPYLGAQVLAAGTGAVLFFKLQREAEPVTMSFVGYVMALTAVLVGAVVLGETLPWQLLPCSALIAGALALILKSPATVRR
jgi:drug/metabolite transporter (DMT)-like permease